MLPKTFKKTYLMLDFKKKDKYNGIMLRIYVILQANKKLIIKQLIKANIGEI